jgi:hypothetical protein
MVEISWGKAFGYGLKFILFIIVWAIIGGVVAIPGGMMIASSVSITWNSTTQQFETAGTNLGGILTGVAVIIIGALIVILGAISTYFRLMSKLVSESAGTTQRPPPP